MYLILQIITLPIILFLHKKKIIKLYHVTILCFLFSAIIPISYISFVDWKLQIELEQFDLDEDGIYSLSEQTEEQKLAVDRVIHDTGRNFARPFYLLISLPYTFLVFIVLLIIKKVTSSKKNGT